MCVTVALVLGLLAIPQVLAWHPEWDSDSAFREEPRGGLRGGVDPSLIKRHVYTLSEFCPKETRVMRFGDEIIVMSQRPWDPSYPSNMSCTMMVDRDTPELGLIINVLKIDTPDCRDRLDLTATTFMPRQFCGPDTNVTDVSYSVLNASLKIDWRTEPRTVESNHTSGFQLLITAYEDQCKENQACFPCLNGNVIDQVHMCNGFDNCGDYTDEDNCPNYPRPTSSTTGAPPNVTTEVPPVPPKPVPSSSSWTWVPWTLLSLLLIVVIGLSYYTYKLMKRVKQLQEQNPGGLLD